MSNEESQNVVPMDATLTQAGETRYVASRNQEMQCSQPFSAPELERYLDEEEAGEDELGDEDGEECGEENDNLLKKDFDRALHLYRTVKHHLNDAVRHLQSNVSKLESMIAELHGNPSTALPPHPDRPSDPYREGKRGDPHCLNSNAGEMRSPIYNGLPQEVNEYLSVISINECFDNEDLQLLQNTLDVSRQEMEHLQDLRKQLTQLYINMTAILVRREEMIVMHEREIFRLSPATLDALAVKQRKLHSLLMSNLQEICKKAKATRYVNPDLLEDE